ncbi:hypothetical protein Q644_15655 [Brucella intermedia 229E]|uniref:Flagellar hook-length control protein FliK n=1 Tax=Brucella intermedia 229E TaxID=1337887 RepID=U4VC76_9HYPH|nr:hypothetical protein Q644_15655 [Brucella intermedia 229E]
MSVDILLNSTSRLASLARNSGPSQAKAEAESEGGQADPAKLFSSLLERPQGKVERKDEKDDAAKMDEAETRDEDGAKQAAIFVLPQNLLSLATSSPDLKGPNHNFATGNIAKNDKNPSDPLSALIKEAGPEGGGEKQVGELPDAHVDPKKGGASPGDAFGQRQGGAVYRS